MHTMTFFPLGNADCTLIRLSNERVVVFDFGDMRTGEEGDMRADLSKDLKAKLKEWGRDSVDVLVWTHLDWDHTKRSSEFFYLDHATKYQGDDRIKVKELWVPASLVCEVGVEDEARVLRAEARHRLKAGKGIRVFSRPDMLKDWFSQNEIDEAARRHLLVDAGTLVPGFTLADDEVEFFVHSPLAGRQDDGTLVTRNRAAIVVQATFEVQGERTQVLLTSDVDHECIGHIVNVTRYHKREDRLRWDLLRLPHHCSYTGLGPDKGEKQTVPTAQVRWLLEQQSNPGAIIVSTSKPIPDDDEDKQPPHRQAAAYYKKVRDSVKGAFYVTMEEPRRGAPAPLVFKIERTGVTRERKVTAATGVEQSLSMPAPRAG